MSVGEDAQLNCTADGNPLKVDHVTWRREGFPEMSSRTSTVFRNNTSVLTILKATKEDIGAFLCVVNNGLGNETSAPAFLLVKRMFARNTFFFYFISVCKLDLDFTLSF